MEVWQSRAIVLFSSFLFDSFISRREFCSCVFESMTITCYSALFILSFLIYLYPEENFVLGHNCLFGSMTITCYSAFFILPFWCTYIQKKISFLTILVCSGVWQSSVIVCFSSFIFDLFISRKRFRSSP